MKKRKLILPSIALAVMAAFGLAACGGSTPAQSSGGENSQSQPAGSESSEVSLGEITITAAGNKTDLLVGETVQLTASVEGVTWKSRATTVATVDDKGLVTAVGAGSVKIRAEKDGYDTGSITINVSKAPEKEAHTVIDLEHADHYSPTDIWGMDLSAYGYGFMGPGDSPIEDNSGATEDGHSLGWLQQGCKETLTFTANKAVEVELGVSMAYNAEMDLASSLSVKFNNVAIDMTGKVCEGPEDGDTNNYYDWHTTSFGKVNLVAGNNVLEIEMIGQGPNMDVLKIYSDDKDLTIAVVEPVVMQKIAVTPDSVVLEIGGTQQLTTETADVTYASSNEAVATVSTSGLVTAVAAGNAEITVSKEGMKSAKVSVKVKAAQQAATAYDLVEGTAVRMEFENGEFYCESGSWGYPQWGMAPSHDGGETPIEDVESASGGMSLGYFNQTSKVTLKFNSPKAGTVKLVICGAAAGTYDLAANVTIKVNDTALDLTGKTIETTGYTDWQTADLGSIAVNSGSNTLVLEVIGQQGPNLDYIEATLA